jgi:colanic acid biosynthesis glycosyl transferase WcaI
MIVADPLSGGVAQPARRTALRFIVLTQYYAPEIGAPQTRLASVAQLLRQKGHRVSIVTAMPNHLAGRTFARYRAKVFMRETLDGIPVTRTWIYPATGMGAARLLSYLSFAVSSLAGLMTCGGADVIFIESPPLFLALPGIAYARLRGIKTVFNVADLWPDSVRELGGPFAAPAPLAVAERLERWIYRSVDAISSVSDGIARTLTTVKGVPSKKVILFPNGVDTTVFAPRLPDPELYRRYCGDGSQVILYAGTHGAAQGLENVIAAAALLRESNARFLFVGDGHTKARLRARTSELELRNVDFVDSVPLREMPRYFSIAAASVVPLLKRDLFKGARPSKIFPSLASGVPVVYSGEGESATLVEQSGCGVVTVPESAADLARGIRLLLDDAALRERCGRNARALACTTFGWDGIVTAWLDRLRECLDL